MISPPRGKPKVKSRGKPGGKPGGKLSVVATPIGNLGDISARAIEVLREAHLVICEDTRISQRLFDRYGIDTRVSSLHRHNEKRRTAGLVQKLQEGCVMALISDAGTPVVSDPGRELVAAAHEAGVEVISVSGPNAAITALAGSGIDADRFVFEGFLPSRRPARLVSLARLRDETRTMVFYEAPHRIAAMLEDLELTFDADRPACLAKELSKVNERFFYAPLQQIRQWLSADASRCKGEFVVVVSGVSPDPSASGADMEVRIPAMKLLESLVEHLPVRTAARIVAKLGNGCTNSLYKAALEIVDTS